MSPDKTLTKPEHVKKKIWDQHVSWMKVMREGQLTGLAGRAEKDGGQKGPVGPSKWFGSARKSVNDQTVVQ